MQYSGTKASQLTFKSTVSSDIYVSRGSSSDPNNFVYDGSFSDVTKTSFDATALGLNDQGFSVAVYVAAIDEPSNKLLEAEITIDFSEKEVSSTDGDYDEEIDW